MVHFIEKTWFLWWTWAALVILRWFHLFSSRTDDSAKPDAGMDPSAGEYKHHRNWEGGLISQNTN